MINVGQLDAVRKLLDHCKAVNAAQAAYFVTSTGPDGVPTGAKLWATVSDAAQLWHLGVALQTNLMANIGILSCLEQLIVHAQDLPDEVLGRLGALLDAPAEGTVVVTVPDIEAGTQSATPASSSPEASVATGVGTRSGTPKASAAKASPDAGVGTRSGTPEASAEAPRKRQRRKKS